MSNKPRIKGKASAFDVELGQRLRFIRNRCGYTQERLASEIGITFQQLQKYEKGSNRITAQRLAMAADALGTSFASLIGEDRKNVVVDQDDPLLLELLRSWRQIGDEATRRAILRFIRSVSRDTAPASCRTMAGHPRKPTQRAGAGNRRA